MAIGLFLIAFNEFKGRKGLRRLDPSAARLLGYNQIAFGGLIIVYGAWSLYEALAGPSPYEAHMGGQPDVARMLEPIEDLHKAIAITVYCGLIIGSIIVQGFMARYHFNRGSIIRAYAERTPRWVLDLQDRLDS